VRIDYFDGRYVCEQMWEWLMTKFPTSNLVTKSSDNESHLSKRKVSPLIRYTSNTFLVMQKYTFNCPVHRKCGPHIWTLTTGQWGTSPTLSYNSVINLIQRNNALISRFNSWQDWQGSESLGFSWSLNILYALWRSGRGTATHILLLLKVNCLHINMPS